MKALFLDGSPKYKGSNSLYILQGLAQKLAPGCAIAWADARASDAKTTADAIAASDAVVIGFPLYVDGIPSHLLAFMERMADFLRHSHSEILVYVIVNSGFYDARQNHIAIKMTKLWCDDCGLTWGRGLAAGAGAMVQAAPIGRGPCTNIGKALDELSGDIRRGQTGDILNTEPNFPRFLYRLAAHMGWRSSAKKNGLRQRDLHKKHPYEDVQGKGN